ncbi:mitochondrial 30S ribosomal protein S13 [Lactarius vividus]|nr:mitochondrial 30S ribosomal protein S13 [Lactarius vividus]
MVHILGVQLFENNVVRHALTRFYGISGHTAGRICARLQIHDTCRPSPLSTPLRALPGAQAYFAQLDAPPPPLPRQKTKGMDPLRWLRIEADLKREMRENIAHQRMIGSYVGKRHAMGLPVRGQNTQTNARTARKLNRVERHR